MLIDNLIKDIEDLNLQTTLVETPIKHIGAGEFAFANRFKTFKFTPESAGILQTKFKNYSKITYKELTAAIKEERFDDFEKIANKGFDTLKRKVFTLVHTDHEIINLFSNFVHIEFKRFLDLLAPFENRIYKYELNKDALSVYYHLEEFPDYNYPLPLLKVTRSISGRIANNDDFVLQINNSDLYITKAQFQGYYAGYIGRYGLIQHAKLIKDSFQRYDFVINSNYIATYTGKTNALIYSQLLKSFEYELRQGHVKITEILNACRIFEKDKGSGHELINFVAAFNEHGYKAIVLRMLKAIFQYF